MKVVILAGGFGTRLAEETETRPKPMVKIGGHPIIWHIMKHYDAHESIERLLRDSALRRRLGDAGVERARDFSWRKAAQQTAQVYARAGR